MVRAIDQHYIDPRVTERLRRRESAEPATHDHYLREFFCLHPAFLLSEMDLSNREMFPLSLIFRPSAYERQEGPTHTDGGDGPVLAFEAVHSYAE
jgi:hypothetical protein